MSLPTRLAKTILAVSLCTLGLSSCLSTGVKTLGSKSSDSGGTATTDSDVFSISLVYRDATNSSAAVQKTVTLQGVVGIGSANLVNICGALGTNCGCYFYRSVSDASPVASSSVGISNQNNSMSCTMPANTADPSVYKYVQLRNLTNASQASGLLLIKSTITIDDLLTSSMSKLKVVGVYKYYCTRTFFEGEGVSAGNINCVNSQHLGVITADYNFYTARSGDGTSYAGTGDISYGTICNRNSFLKIQCSNNTPVLEYGFYKDPVAPFLVGIQMTRGPEKAQDDKVELVNTYGYAALPDSAGNCPVGLMKVRQWQAQPASIVQGSLGSNPPSSFINSFNNLNNTVVEAVQPANFVVHRQPNATPCSNTDGDCNNATFAGTQTAQSVAYTALTPVICVIPPNLLSGLL